MKVLMIAFLALLGCSLNLEIRIGQLKTSVPADSLETITPVDTIPDSLFFLTRLDSTLDIYEVRNELISQLTRDLEKILDDHFLSDNTYDTSASFLMHNMVWEGDWTGWRTEEMLRKRRKRKIA